MSGVFERLSHPLPPFPGLGSKTLALFKKMVGKDPAATGDPLRPIDVLFHLPNGVIDRRRRPALCDLSQPGIVTVEVVPARYDRGKPMGKKSPPSCRVLCQDGTGAVTLVFFKAALGWIRSILPLGEVRFVSGRVDFFHGQAQMVHPDYILTPEAFGALDLLEPIYPLVSGISQKTVRQIVRRVFDLFPQNGGDDPLLQELFSVLRAFHFPQNARVFEPFSPERLFLVRRELFAHQWALLKARQTFKKGASRPIVVAGTLADRVIQALPYCLTSDQRAAWEDCRRDLACGERMCRFLQGDVGSGKTIVAFLVCLLVMEAGYQATLMAPTDLLARQHLKTLAPLALAQGVHVELLTGREKGKGRERILKRLKDGEISLLIGTHALFQDDVVFQKLGLIVVDEQHRFGVAQRHALEAKAAQESAHLLTMSATPIPRTLTFVLHGDMDLSVLKEKPKGRLPIVTRTLPVTRLEGVIQRLREVFLQGHRAYWVCPLIEEGETERYTAAEERFAMLQSHFGERVGLVHGRLSGAEKDAVMEAFASGTLSLLVSTTVIEVGVHVQEACVMIIENAERFGLSQLHQLRGRVGRGSDQAFCLLLYHPRLGEVAQKRLEYMRETEDGFAIAQADLTLRGAGDALGTKQSGLPSFRFADPVVHASLIPAIRAQVLKRMEETQKTRDDDNTQKINALFSFVNPNTSLTLKYS